MSASAREVIDEFLETARLHDSVTGETFLAALSAAGFVVVPREPTEQMLYVAHRDAEIGPTNAREAWSAMLSAAEGKP